MKTTIKQKIKSSYQAILDYFSWLLADDKKKDSIYENDDDVVEQEITSLIVEKQNTTSVRTNPYLTGELVIVDPDPKDEYRKNGLPIPEHLKNNDLAVFELRDKLYFILQVLNTENKWFNSSDVGDLWCKHVDKKLPKYGGSQYASKTLNELVKLGYAEKNNQRKYRSNKWKK
jgi:hypothetical protein